MLTISIDLVKVPSQIYQLFKLTSPSYIRILTKHSNSNNMNFLDYVMEVTIVFMLYIISEYIIIPKIIQPISQTLKLKWKQYLMSLKMSSSTSLFKEDSIPYQSHTSNRFKSTFYTFTAMTPITSPNSDESTTPAISKLCSFTSSPGLVSKYLDDCEVDRCATAKPILLRESLDHITKDTNSSKMTSGSTPFISSPSMVEGFFDRCEAERECDSHFEISSSLRHLRSPVTAKRPKPLPRRVVLLQSQRI